MLRYFAFVVLVILSSTTRAAEYLAVFPTQVLYVNWLESKAGLDGELQSVYDDAAEIPSVKVNRAIFRGVRSGSALRLSFVQRVFGSDIGTTISGSFSATALQLNFPASQGGFTVVRFTATTTAKFNAAITALQRGVAQRAEVARAARRAADEARLRAEARARQERGITESNAALANGLRDLETLVSSVAVNLKQLSDLQATLETGLVGMMGEVDSYERDAATFSDCTNAYEIRSTRAYAISRTLGYEVGRSRTYAVTAAANTLERDAERFSELPERLRRNLQTLTDWVNAGAGASARPTFTPAAVRDAIARAQGALTTSRNAVKEANDRVEAVSISVDALRARVDKASDAICP